MKNALLVIIRIITRFKRFAEGAVLVAKRIDCYVGLYSCSLYKRLYRRTKECSHHIGIILHIRTGFIGWSKKGVVFAIA